MNIFTQYSEKIEAVLKSLQTQKKIILPNNFNKVLVDKPPSKFDHDLSTNISMVLSKINKKSPEFLAKLILEKISKDEKNIEKIEFTPPGFINIKLKSSFWNHFLLSVYDLKNYGSCTDKKEKKYLIEFVSANPTGPLHVGHCRGAIIGDVLSNILSFNNINVTKEYYINDHGSQIDNFSRSVFLRIQELVNGKEFPFNNSELYPGTYILDIAKKIVKNNKDLNFEDYDKIKEKLSELSIYESMNLIKEDLKKLGIEHDNFVSEKKLVTTKEVERAIKKLEDKKLIYRGKIRAPLKEKTNKLEEREQLLFKSTEFGDDKDRALTKSDNSWTYFAGDIAYHNNKILRKYDLLINILGADHTGYIKRISSIVYALSNNKEIIKCKVSQLVKLIKKGKPFKMSKRKGEYITVDDLLSEVGRDATRFIMLSRSSDVEIDFDFEKIKEKSKDNHLYYIQYCYARISSVLRKVKKLPTKETFDLKKIYNKEETEIIRKIAEWPNCVKISSEKLEPHRIASYLFELASLFHSYWNMGKLDPNKRFLEKNTEINSNNLIFLKTIQSVIKTGMNLIGVNTPEKM